jgi:hypothetical protein
MIKAAVAEETAMLTIVSRRSLSMSDPKVAHVPIMTGIVGPFEYDNSYCKSRTPINRLVPLLGVPHSLRRGPPRRGCGEGGRQMKIARRVILSLASVAALALAGGAHWRVG